MSRRSSRDELLSLHRSLVEIESISGNEYAVGNFLVEYLTNRGYGADLQFLDSKSNQGRARFNVLAWPGKSTAPKPRILVSSHIDVVPPYIPYSIADGPITEKTMISGRGSVDAKASVAAQIIALEELLSDKKVKENDAMLLFVVGEETSGDGMRFFSDAMDKLQSPPNFEAVIFGEPTENKLACGHKGSLSCVLEAQGHAGHSGYPWLGKSANELIVKAVSAIVDADLGSSEEFGNTTTNIGILDGGIALNVIPEHSTAKFMCRVAIGTEENGNHVVEAKIREIIVGIDPTAFKLSCSPGYGVVKTACDVEGWRSRKHGDVEILLTYSRL